MIRAGSAILSVAAIAITLTGAAQVTAAHMQQYLGDEAGLKTTGLQYPSLVRKFYGLHRYQPAWITPNAFSDRRQLLNELQKAASLALEEKDYHFGFIKSLQSVTLPLHSAQDSIIADLRLTDAAIHFFGDVQSGRKAPYLAYDGLNFHPDREGIPERLIASLAGRRLKSLCSELEPVSEEYRSMKKLLFHFDRVMADSGFREVYITSARAAGNNLALLVKLYQLGITDSIDPKIAGKVLLQKIQSAQRMLDVLPDGSLRSTTLHALNTPLSRRREELCLALNYLRWLNEVKKGKQPVIIVNVPSATLFLYAGGKMVLDSRIVVGKPSTPTPTLSSRVTEVVLYPYWSVPDRIATRELLPQVKKDRGYLVKNNFQVLDRQGRIVDPSGVDWLSLNPGYFPYRIRQSTGCDNSLGIVKLNFYNPYSVYLHDTPWKGAFLLNRRYFSHGCMRVEKALELSRMLLKGNTVAVDTLEAKGCLFHQSPVVVPATEPISLYVIYSTAWYLPSGQVLFCKDVYEKASAHGR